MRGLRTAPVICWRSVWRWGGSWSTQVFRQAGDKLSCPGAFLLLFFLKTWHTSSSLIWIVVVGERGVAGVVWMVVWRGVQGGCGVIFQTYSKRHSNRLPGIDSPECWGMVSCNWWYLSYLFTLKHRHWKIICSLACQNNTSLPLWSPFPGCIWPVCTRLYPLSVSIFFGLTELSEFGSEPWFVIVVD